MSLLYNAGPYFQKRRDEQKITLKIFRCLYRWCPPLPIPNREVKPTRADGTAVTRGRVGRCQILIKNTLQRNLKGILVYRQFGFLNLFRSSDRTTISHPPKCLYFYMYMYVYTYM